MSLKQHSNEPHGHWWYNPNTQRMGYHGENCPTKANHPNEKSMENFRDYTYAKDTPQFKTEMEQAREHGMETYSYTRSDGQMNVLAFPGNANTENSGNTADTVVSGTTADETSAHTGPGTEENTAASTAASADNAESSSSASNSDGSEEDDGHSV